METLWAPWRMAYVGAEHPPGCIFCVKPAEGRDEANYILRRGAHAFVLLNAFPYNSGHLMVAPYRHTADLSELPDEELLDVMHLAQESLAALGRALRPHGHNLGINLGQAAGAGIVDHVHLHIVPRWTGDTNFMPVMADTKVLPEALAETYRRLRDAWGSP